MKSKSGSTFCGTDLGTTNSLIGIIDDDGKVRVLKNAEGEYLTPSVVLFRDGKVPVIGRPAKNEALLHPQHVIPRVKRSMGNDLTIYKDDSGKEYRPEEISAMILKKLKQDAETQLQVQVKDVVISVPHYFTEAERRATKAAGEIAGFDVMSLISEPVAALLSYGIDKESDQTVLVFDFGGGTLDVTLARIENGVISVIGCGGDKFLGGEDIDGILCQHVVNNFKKNHGVDLDPVKDNAEIQALRDRATRIKESLSVKPHNLFIYEAKGKQFSQDMTRDEFNELCSPIFEKAKAVVERLMAEQGMDYKAVDKIIPVGGSSRIPKIHEMLRNMFGKEPVKHESVDPDKAIVIGATIKAAIDIGKSTGKVQTASGKYLPSPDIKFEDIVTHSLGVAAFEGKDNFEKNCVIIPKCTGLPVTLKQCFRLVDAKQTAAMIRVLEGDDNVAADKCQELLKVEMNGLPQESVPTARIEVTFEYSQSGILKCIARDLVSGKTTPGEISHTSGLSKKEIDEKRKELEQKLKKMEEGETAC